MTDHPASVVRQFINVVWNGGQVNRVAAFIHPDDTVNGTRDGPAWVASNVPTFRAAFLDLTVTVEVVVSERDRVASLVSLRGTHRGTWKGIPATGRTVHYREAAFWTIQDGRIASGHFVADALALRVQLGQVSAAVWLGRQLQERPGKVRLYFIVPLPEFDAMRSYTDLSGRIANRLALVPVRWRISCFPIVVRDGQVLMVEPVWASWAPTIPHCSLPYSVP